MVEEPSVRSWPAAFNALRKLFSEPQHLTKGAEEEGSTGTTEIDYEEQTAGYQAAYSRLAASATKEVDVVAYVPNPQEFLQSQLQALAQHSGQDRVSSLLAAGGGPIF